MSQLVISERDKDISEVEHAGDAEDIPQDQAVKNIVELRHFDIHLETRIICDASHDGLGAVLEQYSATGWHPISFASRYPNPAEKKIFYKRIGVTRGSTIVWYRMISNLNIDSGQKWEWQIICLGFHLQRRPTQVITMKNLQ